MYVQYGCGFSAPKGWLNFDSSPTLRIERFPGLGRLVKKNSARFPASVHYGNIVRGLPVQPDAAAGVYASHVLEHLTRDDFSTALKNTFRILRRDGIFRLVVPDLEERARLYLRLVESGSKEANDVFMRASCLGQEHRPSTLVAKVSRVAGGSLHLWMWDFVSMKEQLEACGFKSVRRCEFGDCPDPMFAAVEDKHRFHDDRLGIKELALEAIK